MNDPDILRLNERLKLMSNCLFNLAAVLLSAFVARVFTTGTDVWAISCLVGEIPLFVAGWGILGLLEAEI